MSRGNRRQVIFEDARDRRRFDRILAEAAEEYGVEVFVECKMGTHYHLVVRTPRANISEFMGFLNGEYAKYSNRRHQRIGHLFGERFKPILVDTGMYLRIVVSYVLNNPVVAGYVKSAGDWKWNSYRATAGTEPPPPYLRLDWLETTFPGSSLAESREIFERYVNSPSVEDAEMWLERVVIGDDPCNDRVRRYVAAKLYTVAVPKAYRALHRPPLNEVIPRRAPRAERNTAILRAHVVHAYSMSEIGRYLGMHPNSVSRVVCSLRARWTEL
jgi:REP element-mobilizing transposase RayT